MTNSQDAFALSSNGYSTEKFYTAATDGGGGSSLLHLKIPPSIAGEMGSLVAMRVLPDYRTSHDIVRDSLVHRLHQLTAIVKDPAALLRIQDAQDHLVAVNYLQEVERKTAIEGELQRLAYSVSTSSLTGRTLERADTSIAAAMALLGDRPDIQAILRAKLNGT